MSAGDEAKAMENSVTDRTHSLKVAVCVLTYKRPDGLTKLLEALQRQVHHPERPYALSAVVVDNDADASARAVAERYQADPAYELIYVVEPQQGIPLARNRALVSVPADTDLVCFIDDDEWPVDNWLDAMLSVYRSTEADCVYGPVEPVYPDDPPAFFIRSRVFERKRNRDGARIGYAASNNVMIDYRFVREHGLRFEERMRFTGGTDYRFFHQAIGKGMRIFWAEDALVYDIIPASRMTWKWVLQRQFRLGNTFAVTDAMDGSLGRRVYRLAYGAGRIGLGLVMLPALLVSPYWGMRSLTHILRGAGAISGILGHAYQEYAPARLSGT
jgi:glycosyltransferase involved in cell wall biosynthesis